MYLFEVKIKIVLKIILISSFHWSWLFSFFTQYIQGSEVISFGTSLLLLFLFLSKDSQLFPRIWYPLNVGLFKEMTVNPSWYFAYHAFYPRFTDCVFSLVCFFLWNLSSMIAYRLDPWWLYCDLGLFKIIVSKEAFVLVTDAVSLFCLKALHWFPWKSLSFLKGHVEPPCLPAHLS